MLYKETVSEELYRLLTNIQQKPFAKDTYLVGGTALALQYGHRISVDLDFFGSIKIESSDLIEQLKLMGNLILIKDSPKIKVFSINQIKVDFVDYSFPWLERPIINEGIRLASSKDIAAMKIAAITGRGHKKDFIDLYLLLNHYSLKEMLNFYLNKYQHGSEFLALKSLTYFEDADIQPSPKMLFDWEWDEIKSVIKAEVSRLINS
ncbi:MAG: nucleotidyl transferase AbiEii/AbiGii toxin family protein [Cyclobacteriaceae bacterium]|nr:nucleotidyl transferase AbiEii/AbiGii toxin family protein [Cyclobacteriaceae bacterium]